MKGAIVFMLMLGACAHGSREDAEPQLVISGPKAFVDAAYKQAKKCGYEDIERQVQSSGEKLADSNLDQHSAQVDCFGDWIAAIPDATFAVVHTTVVF